MGYLLNIAKQIQTPERLTANPSLVVNNKPPTEMDALPSKGTDLIPAVIVEPWPNTAVIWRNHYPQGTPEARKESLQQVMMAIWATTFNRVAAIWPMGFVSTPEMRSAEIEIERVQNLVLSGKAKLEDFRNACLAWKVQLTDKVNLVKNNHNGGLIT